MVIQAFPIPVNVLGKGQRAAAFQLHCSSPNDCGGSFHCSTTAQFSSQIQGLHSSALPHLLPCFSLAACKPASPTNTQRSLYICLFSACCRQLNMATANDKAVLQSIFQPYSPFGEIPAELEEEYERQRLQDKTTEGAFDPELLEQVVQMELEGVRAAEEGELDKALEKFSQAIQLLPERAAAYNNRAQALRLKGDVKGALEDLEVALKLSRGAGHVACQGFVQRGLLRRLQGHEGEARRDFEEAARLGSPFARQQLVLMNPYAALCNQMLAEVMKKLRGGVKENGNE
uniref:Tetratricopeptide repeat protein 36 n=1 Tax=Salvator merianae TaxID=96440 RepID=A0A8D0EAF4_SALMN